MTAHLEPLSPDTREWATTTRPILGSCGRPDPPKWLREQQAAAAEAQRAQQAAAEAQRDEDGGDP